jgi:hypothetical protein
MVLSDEAMDRLRSLNNDELRAIKVRTSEARIGSHDHELFRFVDRLLLVREGTFTTKSSAKVQFEKF